jgi:hypothetical protein
MRLSSQTHKLILNKYTQRPKAAAPTIDVVDSNIQDMTGKPSSQL